MVPRRYGAKLGIQVRVEGTKGIGWVRNCFQTVYLRLRKKNHKSQREHWFYWNLSSLKLRYPLKIGLPNQKVVSQPQNFRGFIVHLSLSLKTYGPISAKPTSVGKGIFKAATHCIDPKENGLWCWRTRGHTSLPVLEHFEVSCGLFWTSLCLDITYVHQRRNTAMYVHIQYIIQYMLLNTRLEHVSLYFQLNLLNWSLKFVFKHRFTVDIPYSQKTLQPTITGFKWHLLHLYDVLLQPNLIPHKHDTMDKQIKQLIYTPPPPKIKI